MSTPDASEDRRADRWQLSDVERAEFAVASTKLAASRQDLRQFSDVKPRFVTTHDRCSEGRAAGLLRSGGCGAASPSGERPSGRHGDAKAEEDQTGRLGNGRRVEEAVGGPAAHIVSDHVAAGDARYLGARSPGHGDRGVAPRCTGSRTRPRCWYNSIRPRCRRRRPSPWCIRPRSGRSWCSSSRCTGSRKRSRWWSYTVRPRCRRRHPSPWWLWPRARRAWCASPVVQEAVNGPAIRIIESEHVAAGDA